MINSMTTSDGALLGMAVAKFSGYVPCDEFNSWPDVARQAFLGMGLVMKMRGSYVLTQRGMALGEFYSIESSGERIQ